MKVTVYVINKNQPGQYFGLKHADEGFILPYAPNNWKTEKSAIRWAVRNGLEVI